LIPNDIGTGSGAILEDCLGHGVDITKIMKDSSGTIVNDHGPYEIAKITQEVVTPFDTELINKRRSHSRWKKDGIDIGIDVPTRMRERFTIQNSIVGRRKARFVAKCEFCVGSSDTIQPFGARKGN
jgi:hypothetical protein